MRLLLCLMLAGCAQEPVRVPYEVKVPVPVKREPPPDLMTTRLRPPLTFITPADPAAFVCLPEAGARTLRGHIFDLESDLELWRTWAQ